MTTSSLARLALGLGLIAPLAAQASPVAPAADANEESLLADRPIEAYRRDLLDLSFEMISALPSNPFIKDKARWQHDVVASCLELHQPARALAFTEQIENWRIGLGYGDYAFYCVENGREDLGRAYLAKAEEVAQWPDERYKQAWRRDRVRVRVARTHRLLGDEIKASVWYAGVEDSEWGGVEDVQVRIATDEEFDRWIRDLDRALVDGAFDRIRNALGILTQLHDRFYDDEERRALVVTKITTSWGTMPQTVRVDLMANLVEHALEREDTAQALELLDTAWSIVDPAAVTAEASVPMLAKLAGLRHRAGQTEVARAEADGAMILFQTDREKIIDMFRAELLVPVAEAYVAMEDLETALSVYKLAVAEALENVNSRPRAEDLAEICCSMAIQGVTPDEDLWETLRTVADSLDDPFTEDAGR